MNGGFSEGVCSGHTSSIPQRLRWPVGCFLQRTGSGFQLKLASESVLCTGMTYCESDPTWSSVIERVGRVESRGQSRLGSIRFVGFDSCVGPMLIGLSQCV